MYVQSNGRAAGGKMIWKVLIIFNFIICLFNTYHTYITDETVDHLYQTIVKGIEMSRRQQSGGEKDGSAVHESDQG